MRLERFVWPAGKRCAAVIGINLDAEYFGRIFYPGIDLSEGSLMRMGGNGIRYGLPRVLAVLAQRQVRTSFFIPGAVAKKYPEAVRQIVEGGHEIGCHGYAHEILAHLPPEEQRRVLLSAKEVLEGLTREPLSGFRMPEGEITRQTLDIVASLGFQYSSSLSDDDIPYLHEPLGLVELPIHWELFDLPYFAFSFDPPIPPGQARSVSMDQVLQNWLYEVEGARRYGTLLNVQLDPQTIGEQGRIFLLERLLDELQSEDIWLTTGREAAGYAQSVLRAPTAASRGERPGP